MFEIMTAVIVGLVSWSFAEYGIHNWIGHLGRGKNPFSREHLRHHRDGDFTPWTRKYFQAAAIAVIGLVIVALVIGWQLALGWSAGFVGAYLIYEFTHRRLHTHPPVTRYGRMLRRHHFSHHFTNAKFNHGVTSRLWDHVFRTYAPPKRILVPKRLVMPWLVDETGQIRAAYTADYELR